MGKLPTFKVGDGGSNPSGAFPPVYKYGAEVNKPKLVAVALIFPFVANIEYPRHPDRVTSGEGRSVGLTS